MQKMGFPIIEVIRLVYRFSFNKDIYKKELIRYKIKKPKSNDSGLLFIVYSYNLEIMPLYSLGSPGNGLTN